MLISAKIAVCTFIAAMLALCTTVPLQHEPVKHSKKHKSAKKSQVVVNKKEPILVDTYSPPLDILPPPPPIPKATPAPEPTQVGNLTPEGTVIVPAKEYRTYLHKNPPWSPNYKKPND